MANDKPKNPRRARKAKSSQASKLSEAINFVSDASGGDQPYQEHARLAGNWIAATNGIMSAGHPIEEDLALCPHIGRLIDGLNKAGSTLALTVRDNGTLMLSGDKLRAIIPCIPGEDIPPVAPDPNIAAIDDKIKEGFAKLLPLLKHEAERTLEISILLRNNSMFACNGTVIFEFWHGIDLPPWGMAIPKSLAAAVAKQSKKLVGFGFSNTSVTFYFEDGAWVRSQLYKNDWPNVDELFSAAAYPAPVPEGLFEGVAAIENFSKDGAVHFHDDKLKSSYDNYREDGPVYGATYDVPGLQGGHSFSANLLRLIAPVCAAIDYTSVDDRAMFEGEMLRGVIMKRARPAPPPPPVSWTHEQVEADPLGYAIAGAAIPVDDGWGAPAAPATSDDPNAGVWGAVTTQYPSTGFYSGDMDDDVPF